jgi:hypothetical protein
LAAEQVTEQVVEQVAEHLEDAATQLDKAARITRRIDARGVGFLLGGLGVGLAVGFFFGYRWNKEKIKAEAFEKSEEEVEKIRELYRNQADTVRMARAKPALDEVVEERGYSQRVRAEEVRLTRPPVPVAEPAPVSELEELRATQGQKEKDDGWNFEEEVAKRTKEHPYIIHQDEFTMNEPEHSQVTYTYYALDQVLTDEGENKVDNQDDVVGVHNLHNFGHGADDFQVVFVRNERLRMDFEVCLTDQSYQEEVLGLDNEHTNGS